MASNELKISLGFATDKGIKDENEDFVGALIPEGNELLLKGICAAIADGMSGSEAGKLASHCCVASFLSDYYSAPDSWSVKQAAQKVLSATNSWLHSQGQQRYESAKGMVSTLSILVLKSATAHVFHIGDSRIYRLRQGNLEQLTRDHRVWLANGKNYLNRAMGIEPHIEVDCLVFPLEHGDVFLMTTDGIHDFADDKDLKAALLESNDLTQCAQNILQCAFNKNSNDNLTCQVLRIDGLPDLKEDEIIRQHSNLPFPPPLEAGMVLDGYKIIGQCHASKRTHIYKAIDTATGCTVILKAPSVLYDDDTHFIEHFLMEEWAGRRIDNAHVLKILGTNRKKTCLYYVTESIEGQTLRDWMTANPKPEIKHVQEITAQIAKGLRAFHRMEMLHQDLKPENIMIDVHGTVKIIDFGSVKIAGISEIASGEDDENILGTLNYTAPEYHSGQRGTVKSDLYSLGVITYDMLNSALPYGQDMPERPTPAKLAKLVYVPSLYCNEMVPVWMDGALRKATAINPEHRYEDLSEFLYDLSTPNPMFLKNNDFVPLIQRNPLLFWKSVSVFLLMTNLVLLYWLA